MSDKEILTKAIKKAIVNGLDYDVDLNQSIHYMDGQISAEMKDHMGGYITMSLFEHDFAKALWPETDKSFDVDTGLEDWQQHLMQMVIADNPIKYLGENI